MNHADQLEFGVGGRQMKKESVELQNSAYSSVLLTESEKRQEHRRHLTKYS